MKDKSSKIQYVKHDDIDSIKWNQCIDNSFNCRIYSYDWHLDRTAIEWDALIYGNYKFIMPLPYRKKWGIKYLFQPLFSQQLGIFPNPSEEVAELFYIELIKRFRYSNFQLNSKNPIIKNLDGIDFLPRQNYLLGLHFSYNELSSAFSKNTKRNLAKANKSNLNFVRGISLEEYIEFKINNLPISLTTKDLTNLKSLIALGHYKGFGEIYGVYTEENQLCSAVYFCKWKDRVIYFNAASSEEGKEHRGMYFLLNNFIKENAGRNLILDFEGSMIPGIARFYSGFGATPETYFQLKFNRLPLPLKWLKRK